MATRNLLALAAAAAVLSQTSLADEVQLRNGDRLSGTVLRLDAETLTLRTFYAGEIEIARDELISVQTDAPVEAMLADGTLLDARLLAEPDGQVRLKASDLPETAPIALAKLAHVNPPPEVSGRGVGLSGQINVGATMTRGNSEAQQVHLDATMVSRTVHNRFSAGASLDRASEEGAETQSNWLGHMKYDHFLDRRWFLYANTSVERDEFKDLDLRTALGAGAGFQFVDTATTRLSLEGGLNYVNVDYEQAEDERYPAARWGFDFEHALLGGPARFFHDHEGFVSLEDRDALFVRSRTGLRFPLGARLFGTTRLDVDWEKTPAPGRKHADRTLLFNVGYAW